MGTSPYFDASKRNISNSKTRLQGIDEVLIASSFGTFVDQVRLAGTDCHPLLESWMTWLERSDREPTAETMLLWAGGAVENANLMCEDLWSVMIAKIKSPSRSALMTSLRFGGMPLIRTSRAWWHILRDCGGGLAHRKFRLYGEISRPSKVKEWKDVPLAYRLWEQKVG